jgi:hypothetical protein
MRSSRSKRRREILKKKSKFKIIFDIFFLKRGDFENFSGK